MTQRFAIFAVVALAVIAAGVWAVFFSTRGNHLQLQGEILKVRTGEIDAQNSAAIVDFRATDTSDIQFVVREVVLTVEKANGEKVDGDPIAKSDIQRLLEYNQFLGKQYNQMLVIKDKIEPHQTIDRMTAARFEMPLKDLEAAKQITVHIQDVDGPVWETSHALTDASLPAPAAH